jgi:GntR family transcriptional regulator
MASVSVLFLDPTDPTPLHAQLERAIRVAIATGRFQPGFQLPTVRQLAVDLRVNANTVAKVYAHLERAGVLETRRGVGTFITANGGDGDNASARDTVLRALAQRSLAEAAARGFAAGELVRAIEALLKEHERGKTD